MTTGERVGSEFNWAPEARSRLEFAADVFIVDSTIRSLQSGVSGGLHSAADLVEIGAALDQLGVRELIVNVSWRDGCEVVAGLAARRPRATIVATFRARHPRAPDWAFSAVEAGADEICFESPPDVAYIGSWAPKVRSWGRRVSWAFAEDYSYPEIVELARAATAAGSSSLSYHDSFFRFGITPEGIQHFVRSLRRDVPEHPPIYIHLSNFFGSATMTSIAALSAGASAVDVSMNLTGHHCGHTSLAEVVVVLECLYGVRTGIDLSRLSDTARVVYEHSRVPVSPTTPIIGENAFLGDGAYWVAEAHLPHEQRIHARFPFDPAVVGGVERIVWSDRTATDEAVAARLGQLGLDGAGPLVNAVRAELASILSTKTTYPCWLTDAEFVDLCLRVASAGATQRPTRDVSKEGERGDRT